MFLTVRSVNTVCAPQSLFIENQIRYVREVIFIISRGFTMKHITTRERTAIYVLLLIIIHRNVHLRVTLPILTGPYQFDFGYLIMVAVLYLLVRQYCTL